MGLDHPQVSEAPRDGQLDVRGGQIQIDFADGHGIRWNGALTVTNERSQARLLESQGDKLARRPISPQGHALSIDSGGIRFLAEGPMDARRLPECLAKSLAMLLISVRGSPEWRQDKNGVRVAS